MERVWIFAVAAGLEYSSTKQEVILDQETVNVCRKTAEMYTLCMHGKPTVVATAGIAEKYGGVCMANIMKDYLTMLDVPASAIDIPYSREFNTAGEMKSFAEHMLRMHLLPEDIDNVLLVVRWWHAPRAYLLLRASMQKWQWKQTRVRRIVLVTSFDIKGMLREPFAFAKNFFRILGISIGFSDCPKCKGKASVKHSDEIVHFSTNTEVREYWKCQRCGYYRSF